MYFCYLDESGTADLSGNTDHFVYAGIAIPGVTWAEKNQQVDAIKSKYGLEGREIHTGWILRKYIEQVKVAGFDDLDWEERRRAVQRERVSTLARLSINGEGNKVKGQKKIFSKTAGYIHLAYHERIALVEELVACVKSWADSRIFFHAIKKDNYDGQNSTVGGIYQDAFHQIVSRFEQFLQNKGRHDKGDLRGILISDNNETVNKKLTTLMRNFHENGTIWRDVAKIVETPFFVDSKLTSMIQVADVVAYTIRRYFDNSEKKQFNKIYCRVDRAGAAMVGGRHYTPKEFCNCKVCKDERHARKVLTT